jgi:hypothetical protein
MEMQSRAVAALVGGLAPAFLASSFASAEVLITDAEARLPPSASVAIPRGLTRGPGVEQDAPPLDRSARSPLVFKVGFQTRNNVAINPATIRLTYLKANPVDLTDRIRRYITPTGIQMDQAEVPPGVHYLRLDLKDLQGRLGAAIIKLTVEKK